MKSVPPWRDTTRCMACIQPGRVFWGNTIIPQSLLSDTDAGQTQDDVQGHGDGQTSVFRGRMSDDGLTTARGSMTDIARSQLIQEQAEAEQDDEDDEADSMDTPPQEENLDTAEYVEV